MKHPKFFLILLLLLVLVAPFAAKGPPEGKGPKEEVAGNNLSYPVIWADGVAKILPGAAGMIPDLGGEWWYQWGTNGIDPDVFPASCLPDPDEGNLQLNPAGLPFCDDGFADSLTSAAGEPAADNPLPLAKAYLQKDPLNAWQAGSGYWSGTGPEGTNVPVNVHWIDWGDNLESVDWYTRSQVRTEVVLFQDLFTTDEFGVLVPTDDRVGSEPWLEYLMRHTSGWGIDEVHGLAADLDSTALLGPGTRSTVYSHCARLTIQLLLVPRDDPRLEDLVWVPGEGWSEPENVPGTDPPVPYPDNLINDHIFNGSVHEGGDGPGYYSAEINVKGRIIYGYTWNVRNQHDDTLNEFGAGDYRITFSFDETCGTAALNTFFVDGVTEIMVPLETEEAIEAAFRSSCIPTFPEFCRLAAFTAAEEGEEPGGGAKGVLRTDLNLTYMDVRILQRGGGGGGKPK